MPAGNGSWSFRVSGVSPGVVQITASAPAWDGTSEKVTASRPTFYLIGIPGSRTTLSAPHNVNVYTYTPNCGICDYANADITVSWTVNPDPGSPANIVTVTPASVTLHQDNYLSDNASVGTPTSTGTYTLTASATGFDSNTSGTVTVTP